MEKQYPECPACGSNKFVRPNYANFNCGLCGAYFHENGFLIEYAPNDDIGVEPTDPNEMNDEQYNDWLLSHGA